MKKKKVLIVNTTPFMLDGIASVIMNYYKNMDLSDLKIDFIINKEIEPSIKREIEDRNSLIYILHRNSNPVKYMCSLFKIIGKENYDVIHIHGNSGTMFVEVLPAKLAGVKKIIVHCHSSKTEHPLINALFKMPMVILSDYLIACSDIVGKYLYGKRKYIVLNNAVDLEKYCFDEKNRTDIRTELGIKNEFVLGHVGYFSKVKNHEFLINIFYKFHQLFSDSKLVLIGDGHLLNDIKQKVKEMGLTEFVVFMGKRKDVEKFYQAMDVFVFPSLWEGLGMAAVEAQASGLPVVVSENIPAATDLTDEVEYLPLADESRWIEKIKDILLQDAHDRRQTSKNNIYKIKQKNYDIKIEVGKLRQIYID